MTHDLQAAVERLRRVKAGERLSDVYGDDWWCGADAKLIGEFSRASHIDYMRLADAYLLLMDETPLTLDVLKAELGEPLRLDREAWPHVEAMWNDVRWYYASVAKGYHHAQCRQGTRDVYTLGQLRRLLSVVRETTPGGGDAAK